MFALSGEKSPAKTVGIPENRFFSTQTIGWDRAFDTEVKILENIAQKFNPSRASVVNNVTGNVRIGSELNVCLSCAGVVKQFKDMFPNIKVIVNSGPSASKPKF